MLGLLTEFRDWTLGTADGLGHADAEVEQGAQARQGLQLDLLEQKERRLVCYAHERVKNMDGSEASVTPLLQTCCCWCLQEP